MMEMGGVCFGWPWGVNEGVWCGGLHAWQPSMAAMALCSLFVRVAGPRARWLARTWLGGSSGPGRFGDSGVSMGTWPALAAMTAREEGVGGRRALQLPYRFNDSCPK